ncbi:MAG: hypothetical protein AAF219_04790 [Myxococcota bacterium]
MLKDHPIDPVLLSRDLRRSRRFYEQGLNLPLIVAREHMLVYQVGGMGRITVSLSTTGRRLYDQVSELTPFVKYQRTQ